MDEMLGESSLVVWDVIIDHASRRKGLGRHLLVLLELIARRTRMRFLSLPVMNGDDATRDWCVRAACELILVVRQWIDLPNHRPINIDWVLDRSTDVTQLIIALIYQHTGPRTGCCAGARASRWTRAWRASSASTARRRASR